MVPFLLSKLSSCQAHDIGIIWAYTQGQPNSIRKKGEHYVRVDAKNIPTKTITAPLRYMQTPKITIRPGVNPTLMLSPMSNEWTRFTTLRKIRGGTKMNIQDFKSKLAQAKQVQSATAQNGNIRDHVGKQMVVTGMHITRDIEIKSAGLTVDKVTFLLTDGVALDGFHQAAVDKAEELIEVLGEGPYPIPLLMEVRETETKRGPKQYVHLIDFYGTEADLAFADIEDDCEQPPQEE